MKPSVARPLVGLATIAAIVVVVAVAVGMFRSDFTTTVPLTVYAERAGLVMNPDAKVRMRGVEVGRVESIEERADGTAALHLAMNPSQLHMIPSNALVDITSPTVFGAKFVQFVAPNDPSGSMQPGQVLDATRVTVEVNTVFQQLVAVFSKIDPTKLNETLGAISKAFDGRGQKFGQALTDFDALLAKVEPSLPNLSRDLQVAPVVLNAYADAAPDLLATASSATRVSDTIVDQQQSLDEFLISAIGLADTGSDVIGTNRQAITDVLHLLVPTTDLLNEYHPALNCGLAGLIILAQSPPLQNPGVQISASLTAGAERYRYPSNLPKVAAKGGSQCTMLPKVPSNASAPYVVTDTGANPAQYGNQSILLNSDGLKQLLFGPIDGPPRNTAQVGQPG